MSILGTEVEEGLLRQQTVYYAVESAAFGQRGLERRTFEEFEALHAAIQAKLSFPLPELPPTFWYGNSAPDVVGDRRRRLEELLRRLVKLPEVLADGEESLLRFLGLPRVALRTAWGSALLGAPRRAARERREVQGEAEGRPAEGRPASPQDRTGHLQTRARLIFRVSSTRRGPGA